MMLLSSEQMADFRAATDFVHHEVGLAIGFDKLVAVDHLDDLVIEHGVAVGALCVMALREQGFNETWVRRAGIAGALHDEGKREDSIRRQLDPSIVWDATIRETIRRQHTQEGRRRIAAWSAGNPDLLAAEEVANTHHNEDVPAGLPHLTKILDVLHAVRFDKRPYVAQREGLLSSEQVNAIVSNAVKGDMQVIINEQSFNMRPFVGKILGIEAGEIAA